jgi:hypothetical protein
MTSLRYFHFHRLCLSTHLLNSWSSPLTFYRDTLNESSVPLEADCVFPTAKLREWIPQYSLVTAGTGRPSKHRMYIELIP